MLRALGIAFIICCCGFAGVVALGVSYVVLRTDTVDRLLANGTPAPAADQSRIEREESELVLVPSERLTRSDRRIQPARFHHAENEQLVEAEGAVPEPREEVPVKIAALPAPGVVRALTDASFAQTPNLEVSRIVSISTTDELLKWPMSNDTVVLPPGMTSIQLTIESASGSFTSSEITDAINSPNLAVALPVVGNPQVSNPGSSTTSLLLQYTNLPLGTHSLGFKETTPLARIRTQAAAVRTKAPQIRGIDNGLYQTTSVGRPDRAANAVSSYDGFLRVVYEASTPSIAHRFWLVRTDQADKAIAPPHGYVTPANIQTLPNGRFAATFSNLLQTDGETARLYVVSEEVNDVAYSDPIWVVRTAPVPTTVSAFVVAPSAAAETVGASKYVLPDKVELSATLAAANATTVDLVLFDETKVNVLHAQRYSGAAATVSLTVNNPKPGPQTYFLGVYQGATLLSTTPVTPISLTVLEQGPKVHHVDLERLTQDPNGKSFTVYFETGHPLNPTSATERESYSLTTSTPGLASITLPQLPTGDTSRYDSAANTVTFELPAPLPPGEYKFVIKNFSAANSSKGIKGILNHPLNASSAADGGKPVEISFIKVVGPSGETVATSPIAGLRDSNAPYIRYGEYTDPRTLKEGFNPSDKVITRVARLYYFRDAHRVTQIVNRKAKSYNRQAVEVAQQLADQSRRVADAATDARRDVEMKAVRAAQQAREAENTLRDQQQKLMEARQTLATLPLTQSNTEAELEKRTQQQTEAQETLGLATEARKKAFEDLTNLKASGAQPNDPQLKNAYAELYAKTAALKSAQTRVEDLDGQIRQLKAAKESQTAQQASLPDQIVQIEGNIRSLMSRVQTDRDSEIAATERWEDYDRKEQRSREEQFRREVAAKSEDPDTYAPGYPQSEDPVEQVSISVVGEGLIQLRGPRKGVNIVHTMINELDAPVGQVRIAMHTVQINGEHGDRMEKVAERIQRYIDHARFLTSQSAQYLRNAVVIVASGKAEQINVQFGHCPPDERQAKYREAFFGQDFLAELAELDSEFLKAENKVLSLHSMDTTSLASALFLLALAKNDTREEILCKFEELVYGQLQIDEKEYFKASAAKKWVNFKPFHFSAKNARFVNLRGCFTNEVGQPDTLNPCQREFIRLAQIFKSRLVTEIELRQRVMERSLIEQRIGNNTREMELAALQSERDADTALRAAVQKRQEQQRRIVNRFTSIKGQIYQAIQLPPLKEFIPVEVLNELRAGNSIDAWKVPQKGDEDMVFRALGTNPEPGVIPERYQYKTVRFAGCNVKLTIDTLALMDQWTIAVAGDEFCRLTQPELESRWQSDFTDSIKSIGKFLARMDSFNLETRHRVVFDNELKYYNEIKSKPDAKHFRTVLIAAIANVKLKGLELHIQTEVDAYINEALKLAAELVHPDARLQDILSHWGSIKQRGLSELSAPDLQSQLRAIFAAIDAEFEELVNVESQVRAAQNLANQSRRPLDHKKFLDMLVDDVEEKLIELIEGTRAHTANVDNYVGRIATALESDFNTQFYYPAFKHVRETSQYWDVQVGQVETTSVLANNRSFAKVSPQATMEFDLPKRDILINEAFSSALAAYNDYGALLADPQFLALAKMYGGQPASHTYGGGLPAPMVREVLPGLPSQTDAQFLSQAENNVPQIGANLEALIPDPAVYKFETGTGYEIRPVIQPDGQAVVFHLNYMYSTNIREPVRADEKHLGRIKRHFVDTDVQLANYELREVSRYTVALKASRTSRGVPLLEDVPVAGMLFRPLPQQESSLQQNLILAQSVIYPTLFDLMGLRWAPAVADLGTVTLQEREFVTRNRERLLRNEVFDYSSLQVDDFLRVPESERRGDLYRTQEQIPVDHPNGYFGRGMNLRQSELREGYDPRFHPRGTPSSSIPVEATPAIPGVFDENAGQFEMIDDPSGRNRKGRRQPRPHEDHDETDPLPESPPLPPPPMGGEAAFRKPASSPSTTGPVLGPPQSSNRSVRSSSGVMPAKAEQSTPVRSSAPPPPPSRPRLLPPKADAKPVIAPPEGTPTTSTSSPKKTSFLPVNRTVTLEPEPSRSKTWFSFGHKGESR